MCGRSISYPHDFVQEVVNTFPDDTDLSRDLRAGGLWSVRAKLVGNHLIYWWEGIFERQPRDTILEGFFRF